MRNIHFAALGGLLLLASCSQPNTAVSPVTSGTVVAANAVPSLVLASLQQNFPTATQVSWSKIALQTYQAGFLIGSKARIANINVSGLLMSAHDVIDPATLPAAVTDYLKANYAGYTVVRAGSRRDATGVVQGYEVTISVNSVAYELQFDGAGKFVGQETEDGHDEGVPVAQTALPAAITTYLTANYAGYTFGQAMSRTVNGAVANYVVGITYNAQPYFLIFDAAGAFVSAKVRGQDGEGDGEHQGGGDWNNEMTIAQTALPATVTTYLAANYAGYTFASASVDKDTAGAVVNSEVKFTLNGKTYEAEFDAAGKFLKIH